MKVLQYLSWICFAGILGFNIYQYVDLTYGEHIPCHFISLQFADKDQGLDLVQQFSRTSTHHGTTVLQEAILNTEWDFLFILSYIFLLTSLSYNEMQSQRSSVLNNLLRLNFPLIIITGLLDTIENVILLDDMKPWNIGRSFCPSRDVSLPKFILGGWVVLIWLISIITRATRRPRLHKNTQNKYLLVQTISVLP